MKKIQVGPGVAYNTDTGVSYASVYEEGGRVFRAEYDPRQTSVALIVNTSHWTKPEGVPITEEERQRVYDALWQLDPGGFIFEFVPPAKHVPVRWDRGPDGFLLEVAGEIEYMELHRLLHLKSEKGYDFTKERSVWTIDLPEHATWTVPAGEPIAPEHRAKIVSRLLAATDEDTWGSPLGRAAVVVRSIPDTNRADP
jgi:hypothetical protein